MITTVVKKRVIRDFDKLDRSFQKQVLKSFPEGFSTDYITYLSIQGKTTPAIPFETEDTFYLLRLSTTRPTVRKKKPSELESYLPEDDMDDANYSMSSDEDPVSNDSGYDDLDQDEDSDFYN